MIPCDSTLEVNRIWRFDRTVRTQFNGRTLDESSGCHNDIAVISRHGPWFRIDKTVNRGCGLNALTEFDHTFRCAKNDSLNNIMTALVSVRNDFKTKSFVNISRKNGTLQCTGNDLRGKEKSLIKGLIDAETGTEFFSESGSCQAESCPLHAFFFADDIASDRCQTAARIFDERTDTHICSNIGRFNFFHKFTIAVVYHTDDIRFDGFDKTDQFSDALNRQCGTGLVALRALNGDEFCPFIDGFFYIFKVKISVWEKIYLAVSYAVFSERTGLGTDTDDTFQCIIRFSYR